MMLQFGGFMEDGYWKNQLRCAIAVRKTTVQTSLFVHDETFDIGIGV